MEEKEMKKRSLGIMSIVLALTCIGSFPLFAGAAREQGTKLTVALHVAQTEPIFKEMAAIAKEYSDSHPGVTIEMVTYPDFETTMKTKMAARDLPDMWSTHGWSVARYSEYLEILSSQNWASKLSPQIKNIITDSRGDIFVLPFDVDTAGIIFNQNVMTQVGVDPFSLKTWDDFKAACEKIKAAGIIPVEIGGSLTDEWTVGSFLNSVAPSFLVTNDRNNYRSSLLDGSFNWDNWRPVIALLLEFRDKGYLNPDYTQGTQENRIRRLATGQAAFLVGSNDNIAQCQLVNPSGKWGFMPIPSASAEDTPALSSGERITLGVWKDGPHKVEAIRFLEYCSAPAIINRVSTLDGTNTGLVGSGYGADLGELKEYFDKSGNVRGFPIFDRVYLPGGMWDTLCKTGTSLLANAMTVDQAITRLRTDYQDSWAQQ
jgi:raffinose/stachyose/melibiose transport system substrate-binding protein